MKKIWMAAGLAALLVMAGCGQGKTAQSYIEQSSPASSESEETPPAEQENTQSRQQEQESAEEKEISFVYEIDDVFALTVPGTVVTGTVTSGSIKVGDTVFVVKEDGTELETKVAGIEVFREMIEEAVEGDSVGIKLESLEKEQIAVGDRLIGYRSLRTESTASGTESIDLSPIIKPFYSFSFAFEIEGVDSVTEEGVVIIGHVQDGYIQTGATAILVKADNIYYKSTVKRIEIFDDQTGASTIVEWAGPDVSVGALLEGLEEVEISAGDMVVGYLLEAN